MTRARGYIAGGFLCYHGGAHHDTICVAEKRISGKQFSFSKKAFFNFVIRHLPFASLGTKSYIANGVAAGKEIWYLPVTQPRNKLASIYYWRVVDTFTVIVSANT